MPLLHIPGVTFASKVDICKLVMFCHKYLIGSKVLFLNLMQRLEKLFQSILLVIFSLKMSTVHNILKAISSCPIFFLKLSGNVLSLVNFPSCDSVVSMTKIMVNIGKGHGQHVSAVSFNHQNDFKTFSCLMNNHRQRFWQKTTWAT